MFYIKYQYGDRTKRHDTDTTVTYTRFDNLHVKFNLLYKICMTLATVFISVADGTDSDSIRENSLSLAINTY